MKRLITKILLGIVASSLIGVLTYSYYAAKHGFYLGEEISPDGTFIIRFYTAKNALIPSWSLPGDAACEPRLLKLYTAENEKLKQASISSCALENNLTWLPDSVVLPDGETAWELPANLTLE